MTLAAALSTADALSAHVRSRYEVEKLPRIGERPGDGHPGQDIHRPRGISWELTRQLVEHLAAADHERDSDGQPQSRAVR
jgi:hypothetical protein